MRRLRVLALVGVAALVVGGWALTEADDDYELTVVLPNATNLIEGGSVKREGYEAGSIEEISVAGGRAKVRMSLDDEFGPVHEGAKVTVDWKASLGERLLSITDGPEGHAAIPSGGMITGEMAAPVEFDQVLAALDPPTRARMNSLIRELESTLKGREGDTNATLRAAGPALRAIGSVLRGVGTDSQAIRQLAVQLNGTMSILATRDRDIEKIVNSLTDATSATVGKRRQLGEVLRRLPATLDRADKTLRAVPDTVDKTVPLLDDLAPATKRLPSMARRLRPVLTDLRPAIAELRPTLGALCGLLRHTPGLLDSGRAAAPGLDSAFRGLAPALDFLRPYTPELAGWLSNWASATANYDANGHLGRIFIQTGLEAGNVNPGVTSPGVTRRPDPMPGELAGQPWTDAFGGGIR
jgi:phospholipid/cholesterol/gamma-HCH transport system substrate-binding protein